MSIRQLAIEAAKVKCRVGERGTASPVLVNVQV